MNGRIRHTWHRWKLSLVALAIVATVATTASAQIEQDRPAGTPKVKVLTTPMRPAQELKQTPAPTIQQMSPEVLRVPPEALQRTVPGAGASRVPLPAPHPPQAAPQRTPLPVPSQFLPQRWPLVQPWPPMTRTPPPTTYRPLPALPASPQAFAPIEPHVLVPIERPLPSGLPLLPNPLPAAIPAESPEPSAIPPAPNAVPGTVPPSQIEPNPLPPSTPSIGVVAATAKPDLRCKVEPILNIPAWDAQGVPSGPPIAQHPFDGQFLDVTVWNEGADAKACKLGIRYEPATASGSAKWFVTTAVPPLKAGQAAPMNIPWPSALPAFPAGQTNETFKIVAKVDTENVVDETNESNNESASFHPYIVATIIPPVIEPPPPPQAAVPGPTIKGTFAQRVPLPPGAVQYTANLPDLVCNVAVDTGGVHVTEHVGTGYAIKVNVTNNGKAPSGPFWVGLRYLNAPSGPQSWIKPLAVGLGGLAPGQQWVVKLPFFGVSPIDPLPGSVPPGETKANVKVVAGVDTDNMVLEANEKNNESQAFHPDFPPKGGGLPGP